MDICGATGQIKLRKFIGPFRRNAESQKWGNLVLVWDDGTRGIAERELSPRFSVDDIGRRQVHLGFPRFVFFPTVHHEMNSSHENSNSSFPLGQSEQSAGKVSSRFESSRVVFSREINNNLCTYAIREWVKTERERENNWLST